MKLVVNMMMGSYMAASAEGLSLAKAVGLAQSDLIEVVGLGAIATPMFKLKVRCWTGLLPCCMYPQCVVRDVCVKSDMLQGYHAAQAPAMVEGKYATAFPLKHQQKDMRLALERAGQDSLQLPVAAAANQLYEEVSSQAAVSCCKCGAVRHAHASPVHCPDVQAQAKGLGDSDFSAVLETVHGTKES